MTPLILSIDTTHAEGSLALARGGDLLEEAALESPSGFAHVIYAHLEALLARHAVAVDDIDCFAASSGPGAFTGVRVCLACIKGLAEACGKPAVAVSNLAAIASFGSAPLRAAIFDARRGEVYAAVYDDAGRVVMPETVAAPARWLDTLPEGVELVSPDFAPVAASLPHRARAMPIASKLPVPWPPPLPASPGSVGRRAKPPIPPPWTPTTSAVPTPNCCGKAEPTPPCRSTDRIEAGSITRRSQHGAAPHVG